MKHSDHIQNLGMNDGDGDRSSVQHDLLGPLMDAPSSVAALYGSLIRHCGYLADLDAFKVLDELATMEQRGWVTAWQMGADDSFRSPSAEDRRRAWLGYSEWLANAEGEEFSVDEVGLWYEITPEGRQHWQQWAEDNDQQAGRLWTLHDTGSLRTIVIHAATKEVADQVLLNYLSHRSRIRLIPDSKRLERLTSFVLRDGTVVADGYKLMCQYEETAS